MDETKVAFIFIRVSISISKLKRIIKEAIDEELTIANGQLNYSDEDPVGALMPTGTSKILHKKRYGTKFTLFAGYRFNYSLSGVSPEKVDIRVAVKAMATPKHKEIVTVMINQAVDRFLQTPEGKIIDTVVVPSSKSQVNLLIAKRLKEKNPNIKLLSGAIVKATWADVRINQDIVDRDTSPTGGERADKMLKQKQDKHGDEEFEIKKFGSMSMRRYATNFYKMSDEKRELAQSMIVGNNVCIIDDTMEGATTYSELLRVIMALKPASTVGFILLEGA
jgi:hypothetical protein